MVVLFVNNLMQNTMAEQNVPAQAPIRTDEQILPRSAWLQIGKSNLLFDAQKIQKNPIFQISVDILRNTNFFRAFSASASVPAIYIQHADLLRKALDIIPVDPTHPFELPPTGDTVIDFVNQLGYPKPVEFVSNIRVNYVYQPWRAILSLINQCLTGNTFGSDKPRHPVLQMLWGIVTETNIDHAELLWEEFTQGIQTFFSHKASHKANLKDPNKKAVPLLIPYGRESQVIPKGEIDEVFGMEIPKTLITEAIQQSSYYPKYLEVVAKNTRKTPQDSASKQSVHGNKDTPPKAHSSQTNKPSPVKQTKRTFFQTTNNKKINKSPKNKPSKITPSRKVRKGNPSLVDEEDEAQQEPEPQGEGDDPSLELAKKLSLDAHQEKREGEGADADLERAIKLSLDPSFLPQHQAPVGGVAIRERVAEEIQRLPDVEGKGKAIAGSDPGQGHEALAGSNLEPMQEDSDPGKEHVALAGPNPEHMDEDFYATAYPKNLDETDNFGDQFLNDKPTEDDQEKTNVVDETDSIIPDLSHQTNTSAPPVTTPLRVAKLEQDMSEVKKTNHSAAVLASIQSQVPTVVEKYVGTKIDDALLKALERHNCSFNQKENSVRRLPEPMYTIKSTDKAALEEFDLKGALFNIMHKNKSANRNPANYRLYHALMEALIEDENVMDKEVAYKVKDHKRKCDSNDDEDDDDEGPSAGSNQGESTKRRRHDSSASRSAQPPSKDSKQSTKNKLDSNASAAQQPPADTSSAWQITDTRDTPPGPSMQRSDHQSEQSSDDNPITDEGHVSDPEDTDNAHIPKVSAATWFKPIPKEERPATPEPEWTIPSNDYPEPENNWTNVYATTYQDPKENKLQRKMGDIGSFIKWFCKRTGNKKLCKADLEGPPGLVTIQPQLFFNKDLEYLLSSDKERKTSLSISKLKAARYLDFGLEELVPYLWVESERDYDISAAYGITHYVISIKTYERYEYNYLREIVLRRADYKEYKISEKDFKNLHPNDFEDLFLLHLQDKLNHLPKSNKVNLHTADASDFLFKEDYTIVNKPRAVIYRDRDDNKKMMRIDEMHKFSDGTLMRIRDKLDFMVKDFSYKDGKVRSKCENKGIVPTEMELVLEYTQQGASHEVSDTFPIILSFTHCGNKVILRVLRIILVILPEHPSDTKDHLKMEMEMEIPSSSNVKLITECSDTTYTCYEVMKDLIKVSKLPQTLISYSSSQVPIDVFKGITDEDAAKVVDGLAPKHYFKNHCLHTPDFVSPEQSALELFYLGWLLDSLGLTRLAIGSSEDRNDETTSPESNRGNDACDG
ncbi:hypothetical protein Tco_0067269 [Tanacetum coccineum]